MNMSIIRNSQAGFAAKPAILSLLIAATFCFCSISANAQEQRPSDSILGIGIGSSLADAHTKLDQFGTNGGRDTRERGRKEVWTLRETSFVSLALKTNKSGAVVWVSGFLRPGHEIDFGKFGDVSKATLADDSQAIWNVESSKGGYRLVVKGEKGKARVVYLLSLALPPIE